MTGQGGWPLNVFLTPEQVPFYAGTYFPPEPRHGHARAGARCSRPWPRPGPSAARRSAPARRGSSSACSGARAARALGEDPLRTSALDDGGRTRCASALRPRARRLRRRAQVPAGLRARVPARAAASVEMALHDAARDGLRRHLRPGRRRLRALLGGRALARAPLREDALRQRAAGPRVPARLAGDAATPLFRRVCRGDARLGAARDARPRGRLLLGARRRLRGRGGQVLRVDARRAARGRSATTPTRPSPGSAPPSAATSRARTSWCAATGRSPRASREWRAAPLRGARRSASGPASTTSG